MPDERVFSEQEVGHIIRRAVEISEEGPGHGYTPGVTLNELEKIAAEVGVPPDALARAIEEAGQRKGKRKAFRFVEEFERVVEGELQPENFDVLAEGVTPVGNIGQPTMAQFGRSASMSIWAGTGQAKVDVSSRNGRTRLRVRSNTSFQGLMTLYPGFIGAVIAVVVGSENGMSLVGLMIALPVVLLALFLFFVLGQKGHRKAEKLADGLRDRIADTIVQQASSPSTSQVDDKKVEQRLGQGT
jgi:hypothetical protein